MNWPGFDEQAGRRSLPSLPSFSKTSSEITLCKRKLCHIETERTERGKAGGESVLAVLRSRVLHLIGRLERLTKVEVENRAIVKILEDARRLWDRLIPVRLEDGDENLGGEPYLAAFRTGGGFAQTSNVSSPKQGPPTGIIRKQASNPSASKKPISAQLPTWNLDPSIIKTGNMSFPTADASAPGLRFIRL